MPPVTFDWSISLGQIVTGILFAGSVALSAQRIYHLLDKRIAGLELTLTTHAATLTDHKGKLDKYEETLFSVVSDLQRIIGRVEAMVPERRHVP